MADASELAHVAREVPGSRERRLMVAQRVVVVDLDDVEVQVRDFALGA